MENARATVEKIISERALEKGDERFDVTELMLEAYKRAYRQGFRAGKASVYVPEPRHQRMGL